MLGKQIPVPPRPPLLLVPRHLLLQLPRRICLVLACKCGIVVGRSVVPTRGVAWGGGAVVDGQLGYG